MEFEEEFHRGKVPALYYIEGPSHSPDLSLVMLYLIPWLSGTYQVFFIAEIISICCEQTLCGRHFWLVFVISSFIVGTCFPLDSGQLLPCDLSPLMIKRKFMNLLFVQHFCYKCEYFAVFTSQQKPEI